MSNDTLSTSFPASRQDVSRLKQTATDAVSDLSSTAAVHASRAKGQLRDLAGHVQEEGSEHLDQVRGRVSDLVDSAREFATARPLACVGVALAIGFLFGLSRRSSR